MNNLQLVQATGFGSNRQIRQKNGLTAGPYL